MKYEKGISSDELKAFSSDKVVFSNFEDKWGKFRAVFVPTLSQSGRLYLSCAEYTVDYVDELLKIGSLISYLIAFSLILAIVPFFAVYKWKTKNEKMILLEKNTKLEESEKFLKTTLFSIGDGVIVTNGKGEITIINKVAEELTGWKLSQACSKHISEVFIIVNSEDFSKLDDPVQKVIESGKNAVLIDNALLLAKDGTQRKITDSASPIKNSMGHIIGTVLVFRDITEKYRLEEELRQSQKLESIGQLAGGIAHDFNNMLGAILNSAELIATKLDDDETRGYNDIIIQASLKASSLTEKLLTFSRKGIRKKENIDIHFCLDNTIHILSRSIDKKIKIITDFRADKTHVWGNNTNIGNAVLNVTINSRDSMPDGGIIKITTSNKYLDSIFCSNSVFDIKPGEFIEIKITDTGSGINKRIREKIFEPFFTTKEPGKGTGLGLSAVYGTVKDHHGMIDIFSEEGSGTDFIITLPVIENSGDGEIKVVEDVSEFKGYGTSLLVDDEDLMRKSAESMLKSLSFHVISCPDGKTAIQILKEKKNDFEFVILDMIMPGINGMELLKKIHHINPELPVIITSGYFSDELIGNLIDNGACAFISKPYKKDELITILRKIYKKSREKNVLPGQEEE